MAVTAAARPHPAHEPAGAAEQGVEPPRGGTQPYVTTQPDARSRRRRRDLPAPALAAHEVAFVTGLPGLLARTVPFVRDALAAGAPVLAVLPPDRWAALRSALGAAADRVAYADMTEIGRNPAHLLPAWRAFLAEHATDGVPVHGVGELLYPGRRSAEVAECQVHEALLDIGLAGAAPARILCPYDVTALDPAVLAEAHRSHRTATHDGAPLDAAFAGDDHVHDLLDAPLPEPADVEQPFAFGPGELAQVRALTAARAASAGVDRARAEALVLAVNELAANAVDHGGGSGTLRVWRSADALVAEVRDGGRFTNLLAGRVAPDPYQDRGRGLWMVHRLTDLAQVRRDAEGTVVRVHTWLD